jgi:hypothetical protein
MSLHVLPASHPPVWNARTSLATRIVAAVAMAFLVLAFSAPASAQSPPSAPNPSFPVGSLTAFPTMVQGSNKPTLTWSCSLPPDANASDYTFYIYQTQQPSGVLYQMPVASSGEALAPVAINPGFATFELWAVKTTDPIRLHRLDSTTVGPYLPIAEVKIYTEDPYAPLPRTRADRPFGVQVTVNGLLTDASAPDISKGVTLTQHAQSYGPTGTGDPLDRTQATLLGQSSITTNGTTALTFTLNSIPGANRAKVRGEERLSIFSKQDTMIDPSNGSAYTMPAYQLDSQFVQIWPVADGAISGLTQGQILGSSVPELTLQLNDLYPSSTTWAQVYQGSPQLGATGTTVPYSSIVINDSVPANRTIRLDNYGALFSSNGLWTMELLTQTPFGTDRLAQVSFTVQRPGMTLADWRQTHFSDPSNSGDGADENDFDHDGIANVIEFAFGLDPKQSNAGQLPMPERLGDQLAFRFTPPAGITGIRYGAEWSTTLQTGSWTPVPNTGALPEQLFSMPTTGKPRLYLRLTAEEP